MPGKPGVQLTWMDAKVGDWVVTPRIGKPVEINALWHNALHVSLPRSRTVPGRPTSPPTAANARLRLKESFGKAVLEPGHAFPV